MDDYEGYDIYGDISGMGEDLSGLTISGGIDGDIDGNDAAAQWLAQQGLGGDGLMGEEKSYQDELLGSATNADLQLGRISHVEPRIQAGIKAVLSGQSIDGVHPVDLAAAREEFASVIGGDPKAFARQIRVDESVNVPAHKQDIATVMSMIGNTAGAYLERGPGGQLVNTYPDEERQAKADEDLGIAVGYVKELADLYIDGRTRGSSVEPARRLALEESITKRLIDGTFYEGSKDVLPLPNETGVTGIIATQGIYGSAQGTAFDRLSAAKFDELYQTTISGQKTSFVRDSQGYKVFRPEVSQAQRNEAMRNTPSIANSLFPKPRRIKDKTYSVAELDKQKRDQRYSMEQAQYKADFARRVLRQQMPTTRDESKGQMRMSGWDTPYGEQADLQNLRNEAAIQGIDWNSTYAGQGDAERGALIQSELTQYIEEANKPIITDDTLGSPAQGTQAWLDQRKGKITASTAAGLLKSGGVEERAMELAMERLGTADKFLGNAHTREGNEGEDKARRAFMAGAGKGMIYQEAYFEENEAYAGFGVSPDGRLYDEDGNSKGLLELKYLSSGSMKGALSKYTPQMQMQMAITGENETHFYALDKYTGEYVHEIVQADPNMQAQLIEAGTKALELGAGLDNRGVQALRKQIQSAAKPRKKLSLQKVAGQQTAFVPTDAVEETMTAFDPNEVIAANTVGAMNRASNTALAKKMEQQDQADRMKAATSDARGEDIDYQALGKLEVAGYKEDEKRQQARLDKIQAQGRLEVSAYAEDQRRTDAAETAIEKEKQDAQKETTENLRNFGRALKESAGVAAELGGLLTGGNASGMREVRTAAEAGMSTTEARGLREALEIGGLDQAGSDRVIGQAGSLQRTFNDQAGAAGQFTQLMEARGKSNLAGVRGLQMPSLAEFKSMSPQQLTSRVASMMQGKSGEERSAIANIFNMPELAVYDKDPATLLQVDTSINEDRTRDTYEGITKVEQAKREVLEEVGELGSTAGAVGAVAGVVGGVAGSKTVGLLGSRASNFLSASSKVGPKAANAIKSLSTAAKATPIAALAAAVPMATRYAAGIEDDGGMADSAIDVMEFAAYGAAAGSIVPGVGTAIGAGVGAAVGVANEAYEWWSADDAVPKANIGPINGITRDSNQSGRPPDVNVTVTNEISPDLITTTTDVNGDISVDEESSLSTGG